MAGTPYSSIIGGEGNRTEGLGGYVTVLGGSHNLASATHSLAAGYRAHAVHNGSFVWNAWQGDVFSSKRDGEFAVHAPGGVRLQTDGGGLFVDGQRVGGGGGGGLLDGSIATATLANAAVTLPKLAISGTPGEGKLLSYSDGTLNWASAPAGNTGVTGGWALGGNAGTDPAVNFLGTTDDRPLVIRVENEPALRMEWATNLLSVVQGLDSGTVALNVTLGRGFIRPGVVGAIVGGIRHRSNADTLGPNAVYGNDSIALGGASNVAGKPDADLLFSNGGAFVGGGHVTQPMAKIPWWWVAMPMQLVASSVRWWADAATRPMGAATSWAAAFITRPMGAIHRAFWPATVPSRAGGKTSSPMPAARSSAGEGATGSGSWRTPR
jgi:hypothetical protein